MFSNPYNPDLQKLTVCTEKYHERQLLLAHKNILGVYLPSMCIPMMSLGEFKRDSENLNSQAMVLLTLDKLLVVSLAKIIFIFSLT